MRDPISSSSDLRLISCRTAASPPSPSCSRLDSSISTGSANSLTTVETMSTSLVMLADVCNQYHGVTVACVISVCGRQPREDCDPSKHFSGCIPTFFVMQSRFICAEMHMQSINTTRAAWGQMMPAIPSVESAFGHAARTQAQRLTSITKTMSLHHNQQSSCLPGVDDPLRHRKRQARNPAQAVTKFFRHGQRGSYSSHRDVGISQWR